ncbi:kinectin-like isoform X2 [Mizuhopecten yessoensis]|uniref:kinectin-like isoform X2 n=1 Tax=Mizuhopecten yessoensis TaxID=6573 RepID=UPI000B45D80D|nr:kinectin-like isoform X2 [Mizuhopecten yessoensis]
MACSGKSQQVYTVKTLKETLLTAKSWESSEDDFVGICECIEGTLKDEKNLDHIKPYFKRLDKVWRPVSTCAEYKQAKTLLCNFSYLSKHRRLQLLALQEVGYNSEPGSLSEITSDTTRPEMPSQQMLESDQSVSKVASMIEKLTNELEREKKRTALLEEEKREVRITLQAVLYQSTEIEASLASARKGQKKKSKPKRDNDPTASVNILSTDLKESLKRCVGNMEMLKEKNIARETEATCHAKELRDKVLSVSKMIDTFNTPWNEETCLSKKKKRKKGKAKGPVPQSEEHQASTEMTSSEVIKSTSQTLGGIFPKLQEMMECLKSIHDMESWVSAADKAVKSVNEIQLQPVSTATKQDSLLGITDKVRKHMEGICKDYLEQRKEASDLKDYVKRLKHENEEFVAKYQQIEQKHQKHEQGMEVLSQLKQQMEDEKTTIQEKNELQQNYTKEIHQLKHDIAVREETILQLRQENATLSESYTTEICQLENDVAHREEAIQHVRQENETLQERYETDMLSKNTDLGELRGIISVKDEEIKQLKNRKDELLTRLSKQAEMRLTDGNHGITDLSDPNRPTSLAEKFSELYDNEWTEAFEEMLENKRTATPVMTEQSAIRFLLEILSVTNDYCKGHADTHWKDILDAVCQQSTDQLPQIPPIYAKDLRNVRKLTGNISAEGVIKRFFDSEIIHLKLQPGEIGANLEIYIRKCVELCWLMSIQSPPIFLFKEIHLHDRFDEDYFKFYTRAGTVVDFLVWPALLCRENGELLRKGVCQGLKKK